MPMPVIEPTSSIRKHFELSRLFQSAENRHLHDDELREYERAMPAFADRARAAREIAAVEAQVIERVVSEILVNYSFEERHAYARTKCVRDVSGVSAYATLSMLMNDPQWFRDKLLLWLRTILQALYFPDREIQKRKALFAVQADAAPPELAPNQRAIFETYNKLKVNYKEKLSPASFALLEPYLQQAIDTLSGS